MKRIAAHTNLLLATSLLLSVLGCVLFTVLANQVIERDDQNSKAAFILRLLRDCYDDAQDMETGQRGFLLTGKPAYLEPFTNGSAAFKKHLDQLDELVRAYAPKDVEMPRKLALLTRLKETELGATIELVKNGEMPEAMAIVNSDQGKGYMDQVRTLVNDYAERYRLQRIGLDDEVTGGLRKAKAAFMFLTLMIAALIAAMLWKSRPARTADSPEDTPDEDPGAESVDIS